VRCIVAYVNALGRVGAPRATTASGDHGSSDRGRRIDAWLWRGCFALRGRFPRTSRERVIEGQASAILAYSLPDEISCFFEAHQQAGLRACAQCAHDRRRVLQLWSGFFLLFDGVVGGALTRSSASSISAGAISFRNVLRVVRS